MRVGILGPAAVTILLSGASPAEAATQAPIIGQIEHISIADRNDIWSRGIIVVGGQNVIIPRNLLIDLPANRLTLQQLFADAPPACQTAGETGLAAADDCTTLKRGAIATILANRTNAGDVIAGEVHIDKGGETVQGIVTYVDHTQGFFRLNGSAGSATTGVLVRINDPESRHTLQQGAGCDGGPNCSPDTRYGLDPDNYTVTFTTGYPACLPSTLTGGLRTVGSNAAGQGDPFCPHTNRLTSPVPNSFRFAPIQLGDHIIAEGNFEYIASTYFLSAHTLTVGSALVTQPGQPDYLIFAEMEWDAAGFQNERARMLAIGFSTLPDSQLDIFALHVSRITNEADEFPLASTVGNPDTINQGVPPTAGGIFKVGYDVDFIVGVEAEHAPCVNLANAGFTPAQGGCPSGLTLNLGQNFQVLSPISREVIGRSRNKRDLGIGDSQDIRGLAAPNGEYLTPVGIGHPEFGEIDLGRLQTPFIFAGEPWNLDRRLSPGGCDGACELARQPLNPFPFSGLDPRTQVNVPDGFENRILTHFPQGRGGPALVLPWPPIDPPAQGISPTPDPELPGSRTFLGQPLAAVDEVATPVNTSVSIAVARNDEDPDGFLDLGTVAAQDAPANGRVVVRGDGTIEYIPNPGFEGTDLFSYVIRDDEGNVSNPASVMITVTSTQTGGGMSETTIAETAMAVVPRLASETQDSLSIRSLLRARSQRLSGRQ